MEPVELAQRVMADHLTYLDAAKMQSLRSCVATVKADAVPGDFLEFGVALGGSAICLASALDGARRFAGFDVFAMIPPPSDRDGAQSRARYRTITAGKSRGTGGDTYYGCLDDLHARVVESFRRYGLTVDGDRIRLIRGLFEETLPHFPPAPVALAPIDCDWVDPVLLCLRHIVAKLSPGGFVIVDDHNDWPGARDATDQILREHPEVTMIRQRPHAVLRKSGG